MKFKFVIIVALCFLVSGCFKPVSAMKSGYYLDKQLEINKIEVVLLFNGSIMQHEVNQFKDGLTEELIKAGYKVTDNTSTNSDDFTAMAFNENSKKSFYNIYVSGVLSQTGNSYFPHEVSLKLVKSISGEIIFVSRYSGGGKRSFGLGTEFGNDIVLSSK